MTSQQAGSDPYAAFFADPQIREAIAHALKAAADAWPAKLQSEERMATAALERKADKQAQALAFKGRDSRNAIVLACLMTAMILGPTTFLGFEGKLSSEAIAFIFGGVLGSAFTFTTNYFLAD